MRGPPLRRILISWSARCHFVPVFLDSFPIASPVTFSQLERGFGPTPSRCSVHSGKAMPSNEPDLFGLSDYPAGFRYLPELIGGSEERQLLDQMAKLEFAPFQFQGFEGKRRVVSFGWRYDFNGGG